MGLEHSVALYFAIGILLYAIGSLSPDAHQMFEKARKRGGPAMLCISIGMVIGVVFWPVALAIYGMRTAAKARTRCVVCGIKGRGRQCRECKDAVAREVKRDLARIAEYPPCKPFYGRSEGVPALPDDPPGVGYAVGLGVPHVCPQQRKFVCEMKCPVCGGRSILYSGDDRVSMPDALRHECDAGHWGDLDLRSSYIPEPFRKKDA